MIDFGSIITGLEADRARLTSGNDATGQALGNAISTRLGNVRTLRSGFEGPAWTQALDTSLSDLFQQQAGEIGRSRSAGIGQLLTGAAGRGTLGSSGAGRARGRIDAAATGARQQAARSVEDTRSAAIQDREGQALALLEQILSGGAADQLVGNRVGQINAQAGSNQRLAELDQILGGITSTALGSILADAGRFGAAGFDYADRSNRRTGAMGDDALSWFGY